MQLLSLSSGYLASLLVYLKVKERIKTKARFTTGGLVPELTHITDYLDHHVSNSPNKLALVADKKQLTWQELGELVEYYAALIRGLVNNNRQQVVAVLMPNTWEYVVTYLAIVKAGHIAMPIDVIYKPLEITAVINQIQPEIVVTDEVNAKRIQNTKVVVKTMDQLQQASPSSTYIRLSADRQIASVVFTSGTTGKPKASTYTHANHLWNIKVCSEVWDWTANDSLLASLRLSHWYGLVMCLSGAVYHGNTLYLQENFDPIKILESLTSGKISFFTNGPIAYQKMLEVDGEYDLSAVRLCVSGSAPLPPKVWQDFKNKFGIEILETYGSSETGRIAANSLGSPVVGSPGKILSGVNVKISSSGEVLVKSPGVFPGYYKNLSATKAGKTSGGWWQTGDLGKLEHGSIKLLGRVQEKIRKQGYTISPRDVEWALLEDPNTREVAVVGLPQPNGGDDKIVYFIVTKSSGAQIATFCKNNLPSVWRADKIIILDNLPRKPSGKPDLTKLKSMVE